MFETTSSMAVASSQGDPSELLAVVYRSRAAKPLTSPALYDLTAAAQARNSREAITGLMLYDQGRFFQWLEGPPDSVDRVMGSITTDPRHTEIEIIRKQSAQGRTFGDWSMKLAAPGAGGRRPDVIEPPREIVEGLRQRPAAAPSLLVRLVDVSFNGANFGPLTPDALPRASLTRNTATILKGVILSTVIPELASAHGAFQTQTRDWPTSNRVSELADLLIGPDQSAAIELIAELQYGDVLPQPLYARLFEPAARKLGDLWSEDLCSEVDVTIGLSRLQTAVRLLTAGTLSPISGSLPQPVVLIVPAPGELHQLGAALDSDVLRRAGWSPHCGHPGDVQALQELLSATWFDALDLSLSAAFRREHTLSGLKSTIANARRASLNPALVVVVGGRAFVEESLAGSQVGADLASRTSTGIDQSILLSIHTAQAAMSNPSPRRNARASKLLTNGRLASRIVSVGCSTRLTS